MSGMDLDAMRDRWQDCNRRTDAALHLDIEATRKALVARTHGAFRRHSGWLLVAIVVGGMAGVALAAFLLQHLGDWRYALMSGGLLVLVGAELVVDLRQFRDLSRLDLGAPLLEVRAMLDAVRARRLQMAKWIALTAVLLWWPALLVTLKGLTGVDVLPHVPANVVRVNFAIGLACIPIGMALADWLSRRYSGSPGFQRLLVEAAGRSWQKAEDAFAANERFEDAVASESWTPDADPLELPAAFSVPLSAVRRRLNAGIALYASLLVATGVSNAMHGGQALYLVAGVALYLLWLPQMIGSIVHRRAAMAPAAGVSLAAWRQGLADVVAGRQRAAGIVAVLLPLLLAPAAHLLSGLALDWLVAGAVLASMLLAWRRRRADFAAAFADALAFGALGATAGIPAATSASARTPREA